MNWRHHSKNHDCCIKWSHLFDECYDDVAASRKKENKIEAMHFLICSWSGFFFKFDAARPEPPSFFRIEKTKKILPGNISAG